MNGRDVSLTFPISSLESQQVGIRYSLFISLSEQDLDVIATQISQENLELAIDCPPQITGQLHIASTGQSSVKR